MLSFSVPLGRLSLTVAKTSSSIVYKEVSQMSVTAGIGSFTPEVVTVALPGFYQSLAAEALSNFFIDNPSLFPNTPVSSACTSTLNCASYFFSGGLKNTSPNPSYFQTTNTEADAMILSGEAGLQIDYWDIVQGEQPFVASNSSECLTWIIPSQDAGLMICLRQSALNPDYLIAGLSSFLVTSDLNYRSVVL
jgi:hypothetical protein